MGEHPIRMQLGPRLPFDWSHAGFSLCQHQDTLGGNEYIMTSSPVTSDLEPGLPGEEEWGWK